MKRFLGLLVCVLVLNSCNDGELNLKSFNFDPAAPITDCDVNNGLFFKLSSNEALVLQTPISSFVNEVTPVDQPRTLTINSSNRVIYRAFSENVTSFYFCSALPPSSPMVTDERIASDGIDGVSGLIEITTTQIINPTTQAVTGYNHLVIFKNITFANNSNSIVYEKYIFGNYTTSI
jgi:hypothetical protein